MRQLRIDVSTDAIEAFCRKWKVKEFALFGSVLRDDFAKESDVDVLVELQPGHGLSLFDWVDMIDELKKLFGRHVDLVSKKSLKNPIRRKEILRTAEVLYAT